jgi:hypothetical protein
MSENKLPPPIPQPFRFSSPEERERSPIWRAIKQAYETAYRMRDLGLLPEFSPEQIERFKQGQLRDGSPPVELMRRLQEWHRLQQEQAAEPQPVEQPSEPSTEQQVEQVVEKAVRESNEPEPSQQTATEDLSIKQPAPSPNANYIEYPHIDVALADLAETFPDARNPRLQLKKKWIDYVIQVLQNHGTKVDKKSESERKTIGRRIRTWQETLIPEA